MSRAVYVVLAAGLLLVPTAFAAEGAAVAFSLVWLIPFVGILLSIAILPLVAPHFWHHHYGKVAIGWALAFAVPYALEAGWIGAAKTVWHSLALEYIPFILLLYALYTVAGGILVRGEIRGTPAANTGMIAFGTMIASLLGTTGAAMLMIRPLIRANAARPFNVHVFVFFIFLVGNIGGSLTPLGDPPLYLGFLNGVDFFWTTEHLFLPTLFNSVVLLITFYFIDRAFFRREKTVSEPAMADGRSSPIEIFGAHNILLLLAIVALVLASSFIDKGLGYEVFGTVIPLDVIVRGSGLIVISTISLLATSNAIRVDNAFDWNPMIEVALLFIGIFITIIPAIAILQYGEAGELGPLITLLNRSDGSHDPAAYFWLTGVLSAFLDNAPTYLVFFNTAGGDAQVLMNEAAPTLAAISAGAVFFGALTYIGNAPNFMVKTICEERGIGMPSFFGFLGWSAVILLPLFAVNTLLFFN